MQDSDDVSCHGGNAKNKGRDGEMERFGSQTLECRTQAQRCYPGGGLLGVSQYDVV